MDSYGSFMQVRIINLAACRAFPLMHNFLFEPSLFYVAFVHVNDLLLTVLQYSIKINFFTKNKKFNCFMFLTEV